MTSPILPFLPDPDQAAQAAKDFLLLQKKSSGHQHYFGALALQVWRDFHEEESTKPPEERTGQKAVLAELASWLDKKAGEHLFAAETLKKWLQVAQTFEAPHFDGYKKRHLFETFRVAKACDPHPLRALKIADEKNYTADELWTHYHPNGKVDGGNWYAWLAAPIAKLSECDDWTWAKEDAGRAKEAAATLFEIHTKYERG